MLFFHWLAIAMLILMLVGVFVASGAYFHEVDARWADKYNVATDKYNALLAEYISMCIENYDRDWCSIYIEKVID